MAESGPQRSEWQNQARTTTLAFYLHVVAEIVDQLEADAGLVDALALRGYFHIRLGHPSVVCDTNPRLGLFGDGILTAVNVNQEFRKLS